MSHPVWNPPGRLILTIALQRLSKSGDILICWELGLGHFSAGDTVQLTAGSNTRRHLANPVINYTQLMCNEHHQTHYHFVFTHHCPFGTHCEGALGSGTARYSRSLAGPAASAGPGNFPADILLHEYQPSYGDNPAPG